MYGFFNSNFQALEFCGFSSFLSLFLFNYIFFRECIFLFNSFFPSLNIASLHGYTATAYYVYFQDPDAARAVRVFASYIFTLLRSPC